LGVAIGNATAFGTVGDIIIHSFMPDGLTALTTWHGDAIGVNVK
jgi:hypothetical protein